jgi:hypothetical protein
MDTVEPVPRIMRAKYQQLCPERGAGMTESGRFCENNAMYVWFKKNIVKRDEIPKNYLDLHCGAAILPSSSCFPRPPLSGVSIITRVSQLVTVSRP